jgi:uncharacterized protein
MQRAATLFLEIATDVSVTDIATKSRKWTMENSYPTPPLVCPVMLQRWHEISFFHWSCDPALLQPRLPPGLRIDTYDGKAWISLTPFLLKGLRPLLFPQSLGLTFPEMNLRTYAVGRDGPGIWFFSLDAARIIAVLGARASYGLPYYWSDMRVDIGPNENFYFSNRGEAATARIRIAKEAPIAEQSPLEIFLTARFRLYSTFRGRLITAEVSHSPWQLNRVRTLEFEESVRHAMRVDFPSPDFLAHHSRGVDTKIGRPRFIANETRQQKIRLAV